MPDIKAMAVEAEIDDSAPLTPYMLQRLEVFAQLAARECLNAVNGEALEDPCDTVDDIAYSNAVRDCGAAIKARFGLEG